jgi:hypothetical protein
MADETREKLKQIDETVNDLSRTFSKIQKEIAKSAEGTSIWLDATKALQAAQSASEQSLGHMRNISAELLKNRREEKSLLREANKLQAQDLVALKAKQQANNALITSTQNLVASATPGTLEAIKAQQKLNELKSIDMALSDDIKKTEKRIKDIRTTIRDKFKESNKLLAKQANEALKIYQQEKARKELAEKMVRINETLLKPLIGDSKEYAKIVEFSTGMLKRGFSSFLALISASVDRFKELDKAAGDFRDKTGFLASQTGRIDKAAREVNVQFSHLGVTIDKAYESANELTGQFQVIGLVTKEMIASTAQMAANLGISAADAAKFRASFTSIAEASGTTAEGTILAATALAKMGGVAPAAVMKDIAEASGETFSFLAKNPLSLIKATVEARRLGTTVNSLSKAARGLLNYQDSITSELEASALLGKALNFQEARAAAYAGDVVKSRELALKQIAKAGDFTKLNVYQQEALAKAAGMTVEEVVKQQNQQKMLAAMERSANKEDREAFAAYKKMQEEMANNEKNAAANLEKRGRDMVKMQLRQSEINKLTNSLASIWTDISDTLLPIANVVLPVIIGIFRTIGIAVKYIGSLLKFVFAPFELLLKDLFKSKDGVSMLEKAFSSMGDGIQYLNEKLKDFEKWLEDNTWAKWTFGLASATIVLAGTYITLKKALLGVKGAFTTIKDSAKGLSSTLSPSGGAGKGNIGTTISNFLGSIKWSDVAKMAAMMVILAGGLYLLGKSLVAFNDVKWESVGKAGVALAGLMVLGAIVGFFKPIALGMVAVGAAAALLGVGLLAAGKGFEFFGRGIAKIMESIKSVIKITPAFFSGLVKPLKDLADIGFLKLSGVAAGLTAIGIAMAGFSLSSAFASFINFFSGDGVVKNILALSSTADGLKMVSEEIDNIVSKYKSLSSAADGMKRVAEETDNFISKYKSLSTQISGVDGLKQMSVEIDNIASKYKSLSSAADGLKQASAEIDNIVSKYKSLSAQISEVGGFKQVSEEIDNIISKYKSLSTHMSEKIKASVELMATTVIEVKNLNDLKETVDRLVNAINSLGGVAGAGTPVVNVNNNPSAMVEKLDELITLLKEGSIGVNIDGIKASKVLARAST